MKEGDETLADTLPDLFPICAFHGVEEERVPFELRQRERQLHLSEEGLDELADDELAVRERRLVREHESRVAADVGEDHENRFLLDVRHGVEYGSDDLPESLPATFCSSSAVAVSHDL